MSESYHFGCTCCYRFLYASFAHHSTSIPLYLSLFTIIGTITTPWQSLTNLFRSATICLNLSHSLHEWQGERAVDIDSTVQVLNDRGFCRKYYRSKRYFISNHNLPLISKLCVNMSHHEGNDGNNDYDEGAKDNQIESAAKELESEESQTESDLGANVKKQHASSDPNDTQQCLSDDSSIDSQNGHRNKEPLNDKQNPDVSPPSPQTATHTSKDLATNSGEQNVLHIVDNLVNATDSSTPKKVDLCTGCYKETARTLCIQCNLWLGNQCLGRHQTRKDALAHTVLQREAVQICPSHSRPCSHLCVDCQRVVCPACALENCSSHTTQDISWSLDEMRLFLVHKRGLIDKYFQYIRQKQNMVFDDAKRAVIVQTGTLISTLLRRSRALEKELECARVKSLSLLGRQEDAYNSTLHRFFAARPQTPGDGIPAELLDLLPEVKVIPETSITAAMFEPCESSNLGHLDITRQARDSIMLTKLPKHPCCEVIKTPPYPLDSGMLPYHQAGTMVCTTLFIPKLCSQFALCCISACTGWCKPCISGLHNWHCVCGL